MSDFSSVSDLGGDSDVGSTADVNETNNNVDFGDGDGVNDFDDSEEQTSQEDFEYHDNEVESDAPQEKEEMSSEEAADQVENDFSDGNEVQQVPETNQLNETTTDESVQEMSSDEYADSICADYEGNVDEKSADVTDSSEDDIVSEESDDGSHTEAEKNDSNAQEPIENNNDTSSDSSNKDISNEEVKTDENDDTKIDKTEDNSDTPDKQIDENKADDNIDSEEDISNDDTGTGTDGETKDGMAGKESETVEPTETESTSVETGIEEADETNAVAETNEEIDGKASEAVEPTEAEPASGESGTEGATEPKADTETDEGTDGKTSDTVEPTETEPASSDTETEGETETKADTETDEGADEKVSETVEPTEAEPASSETGTESATETNAGSETGNVDSSETKMSEGADSNTDDTEKNAHFENASYQQGQNEYGYLGTCGPTSISNSLNRVTGTKEFTENKVLGNAIDNNLCHKSDNPYSSGGTTTKDVVNIIDNVKDPESNIHAEVYEYDKALSVDDLAKRLDNPGTVAMVGVDSATLWDQSGDVSNSGLFNHTDAPSDHWITVDSPIRDNSGNVTGFNVIDSGGGVDYVDRDKFEAMYMGDEGHTVSDPTAILITNEGDSVNTYSSEEGAERASNYKGSAVESDGGDPPLEMSTYEDFKSLSTEEQIEKFDSLSSGEIYDMVKNSPESWAVDGYDKITPENAKDFIALNENDKGETSFNLDWPKYGGYDPETISSISDMNGKVEVSRDGGDRGYTMGIGRNEDGSYDNNSMRAIPKSSAEVNTGTFDVDKYKDAVDIVSSDAIDDEKTAQLMDLGFDEDSADNMLRDYEDWKSRPEIIGDGNIEQGAKMANPDEQIEMKYGVHGKAAEWDIGGIHMEGGAGQMNTVFSWGTCREAGIITNCDKDKIN